MSKPPAKNIDELRHRIQDDPVLSPEDKAWHLNFIGDGHIFPQPKIFPTVAEMDEIRLREINRQMKELGDKRSRILARQK